MSFITVDTRRAIRGTCAYSERRGVGGAHLYRARCGAGEARPLFDRSVPPHLMRWLASWLTHGGAPSLRKLGLLSRAASLRAYVSPGPPGGTQISGAYISSGLKPSSCLLPGGPRRFGQPSSFLLHAGSARYKIQTSRSEPSH